MAKLPTYYKVHIDGLSLELEPIYTDMAPVVRSNWEITDHESAYGTKCYHCPECGEDEWREDKPKFCPNCGAKMDGG